MATDITSLTLPIIGKINSKTLEIVKSGLPEIQEKTRAFDRQNSQSTLSMMTLTMMNGHSPMRMLRQVAAECESRRMALSESQITHAKLLDKIENLESGIKDRVNLAELNHAKVELALLENKINGSLKDIATLITAYRNIKETHGVEDWDEIDFEQEENRFHIRRGFELLYRNILEVGRGQNATTEYLQQYGVHPQVAISEVSGYMIFIDSEIKKGISPHANSLEDFLDEMANKYLSHADATAKRLFGKADFLEEGIMLCNKDR